MIVPKIPLPSRMKGAGSGTANPVPPTTKSVNPMVFACPEKVIDCAVPVKGRLIGVQLQKLVGVLLQMLLGSFPVRLIVSRAVPVPFAPLQMVTVPENAEV